MRVLMLLSLWQHCSRYCGHIAVFCSIAVLLISIKGRKHVITLVGSGEIMQIWRLNRPESPKQCLQSVCFIHSFSLLFLNTDFWPVPDHYAQEFNIFTLQQTSTNDGTRFLKKFGAAFLQWGAKELRSNEVAAESLRSRKTVVILHQKDFRQVISLISDISWYFHRYIVGQSDVMGWRYLVGPVDGDVLLGFRWRQWDESQRGCMSRCNGIDLDEGSHCLKHCVFIFADFCYRRACFMVNREQPCRHQLDVLACTVYIGARIPS